MRSEFNQGGGTSQVSLTAKETDLFGPSMRKIKRHLTEAPDSMLHIPFSSSSGAFPISTFPGLQPSPITIWSQHSFVFCHCCSGRNKSPLYMGSDDIMRKKDSSS